MGKLLNMIPISTGADMVHHGDVDWKHSGYLDDSHPRRSKPANLDDVGIRKLCLVVVSTARHRWIRTSSLLAHVSVIIRAGTEEKMVRVAARRDVAFVAHEKAFRNWAVSESPCVSVGSVSSDSFAVFKQFKNAVSRIINVTSPQPAPPSMFYTGPEFCELVVHRGSIYNHG